MRVVVAGATGVVGRPIVRELVSNGHEVTGLVREQADGEVLKQLGAATLVADALDAESVDSAIAKARPEVVIDQLTALPRHYTPEAMRSALELTKKLRISGGGNVQQAAERHGAARYVAQSGCYYYQPGPGLADESTEFADPAPELVAGGIDAFKQVEHRVLSSSTLTGVVLRYGFFYGPGTWYWPDGDVADSVRKRQVPIIGDGAGVYSFVHVDDAAAATAAIATSQLGGVFNVTDDEPTPVAQWLPAFAEWVHAPTPPAVAVEGADPGSSFYNTKLRGATNSKFKAAFDWSPRPLPWLND